jgi:catechol 2,3-dioxygenase-like lactoylglutathione lyase family enzyme
VSQSGSASGSFDATVWQAVTSLLSKTGRDVVTTIRGRSMGAALASGSLVRIQPRSGEECAVGDVAVFVINGTLIAHRVVYRGKGPRLGRFVLTQGDGRVQCDPPIETESVLGVVTEYCDKGEWRPLALRPSRSAAGRFRAALHVAFIRACMLVNVPMAKWNARTLLALTSFEALKTAVRASRGRRHPQPSAGRPSAPDPLPVARADHINMNVRNLEESVAFYQRLFGTDGEIKDGGEKPLRWRIIGIPGKFYFCLYEVGATSVEPHALHINHIGFHAPDFDATVRRIKALGVPTEFDGEPIEWKNRNGVSRSFYVKDPNGYLIEFAEKFGGGLD